MVLRRTVGRAALVGLLAAPALADDAHYQSFATGARAAMLGGAYTAIADDPSGLYYNPAGIVDVRRAHLSISTSLYGYERQLGLSDDMDLWRWAEALTSNPVTGADVNIIPAAAGASLAFGRPRSDGSYRHAVAAGVVVPSYRGSVISRDLSHGDLAISSTSRISDRSMVASAGYAYRMGPRLRLGAALHGNVRLIDTVESLDVLDRSTEGAETVFLSTGSDLSLTHASLGASAGVKLQPARRWRFGLSLASPSFSVFQRGLFKVRSARANFQELSDVASPTALESNVSRVKWDGAVLPMHARAGVAYVRSVDYTLALDVTAYAPTSYELVSDGCQVAYISEISPLCGLLQPGRPTEVPLSSEVQRRSPIPVEVRRQWTVNANLGVEKLLLSDLSLGLGFFTDFSSAPDYQLDQEGTLAPFSTRVSNVDHFGVTMSLGYFGEHSLSRLGVMGMVGLGEQARATSPGARFIETVQLQLAPVRTQEFMLYVFWSSSFRYGGGRNQRLDEQPAP